MVTDRMVKKLFKQRSKRMSIKESADRTNMDRKTAAKYLKENKLPSQLKREHNWITRKNSFTEKWPEISELLENNQGLQAKTLFRHLQRNYPGEFQDEQLRTFQRKVKQWRATEGRGKEVYFEQIHRPGVLSQSDFTSMNRLNVTIDGQSFEHKAYHFILTYSNWEDITICFSESLESLSQGLQNALWMLGKAPREHRTDCLSAAVNNLVNGKEFTEKYKQILAHYKIKMLRTNPASPNENGDIEQSHFRFKTAVDQALMIRGSRNFRSVDDYRNFLKELLKQLNSGRNKNLQEEMKHMWDLPNRRIDDCQVLENRVTKNSSIRVRTNTYSVHSRLIGEKVRVMLYPEYLEVWYGQKKIEKIPRLFGKNRSFIQYRHIIDTLIRKPGAFENYKYRNDLYPNANFRLAYDMLVAENSKTGTKDYLKLLYLSAKEGERLVEKALIKALTDEGKIDIKAIEKFVKEKKEYDIIAEVKIPEVDLSKYDELLAGDGGTQWS